MGKIVVGDVVAVTFPFSDLSSHKLRPALVVAKAEFDNLILCQITSRPYSSKRAFVIEDADFTKGKLPIRSYVRPDKLFTADPIIIEKVAGSLNGKVISDILSQVQDLFKV